MTPREVIPAHVPEEVETEVSAALNKMVADERRFSTPDPRIEKLKAALRMVIDWDNTLDWEDGPAWGDLMEIVRKTLEDDDALLL